MVGGRCGRHLGGMTTAHPPPKSGKARLRTRSALRVSVLVVAVGFMVRAVRDGWADIAAGLARVASTRTDLVAVAIAVEVAWTWSLAQVYRSSLVALGGSVRRRDAVRISMGAFSLSRFLPGGGAVGSLFAARELIAVGNQWAVTLVSMIVSWWVSMMALAALVLSGMTVTVLAGGIPASSLVVPAAILAGLALGGTAVAFCFERTGPRACILRLARRAAGTVESDLEAAEASLLSGLRLLRRGSGLVWIGGWALASWAFDAVALWAVFAALGHHLPIGVLLVGYGAANLLQALPELTPGWLGVLEATMAAVYAMFGVPAAVSVVAVLVYRLLSFWLPVAAGLPAGLAMLRRGPARPAGATAMTEAVA